MKRVDQFYFMTNLTKKISLLVVEKRFEISTYFVDYLFDLFKDVNFYNEEKEILNFNKIRIPDIAFIDLQTEGINIFQLIKDLKRANPSINIVLFSDVFDEQTHLACEDSQVEYLISTKSSIFQLKEIIIKCIKNIILKNRNKLLLNDEDNDKEKIDCIDCMNYLLKTKQNSIDLIAHYKGVSFIKKALVLKVDGSFIHIKIDKTHKFVFKHLSHAVISSAHLSSDIYLHLHDIDFKNDIAIFNRLTYIDSYVQNRKSPRVEPSNKLKLLCEVEKRYQNVEILNISMNYILISQNMQVLKEFFIVKVEIKYYFISLY